MQTATPERLTVSANYQRDLERFVDNQRFEEKTDIGERLGYHVTALLHYEMQGSEAYCLSDTKNRPFTDQTRLAMEAGRWKFTGENSFEAERLRLEHEEALLVDAFGRGELNSNVLIKVSKVPDAVVDGTAQVNGYRQDLLRSFVRIYYRTGEDRLSCLIFSLDGNNSSGLRNIENLIGMRIANRPSEETLADSTVLSWESDDIQTQVQMLGEEIILRYDEGVHAETGKKTYAGSAFSDRANALQVVDKHADLFEEHWGAISEVQGRALSADVKEDYLEDTRRKTAAAIKLREDGQEVGSIGDASVSAEAVSGEYGRECATNGMNQTERATEKGKEIEMTCPFCGMKTKGDPCAAILECQECGAKVVNGRVTSEGIGRKAVLENMSQEQDSWKKWTKEMQEHTVSEMRSDNVEDAVYRVFGKQAMLKSRIVVGNKEMDVVDKSTGQVIVKDINLELFAAMSAAR